MSSTNRKNPLAAVAAVAAALCAAPSFAASVLDQVELTNGLSAVSTTIDGVTIDITSGGGAFKSKTVGGFLGTGVAGGVVDGEIDGQEYITFSFSQPVYLTSLAIAHLYMTGNYGDLWNEIALVSTSEGDFFLSMTGATNGTWTGLGSVSNVSPGVEGSGGAWMVSGSDIIGSAITSLTLLSGNPGGASKYADFGFASLSFTLVPTPGGLALLAGIGALGRRRRTG